MHNMQHLLFHFNMTDYPIVTLRSIFIALLYFKHGVVVVLHHKKNNQVWSVLVSS